MTIHADGRNGNVVETEETTTEQPETAKERAIAALGAGLSYTDAAKAAKVARSTLFAWRRDPAFLDDVQQARARHTDTLNCEMQSLTTLVPNALRQCLLKPGTIASLRAAEIVLSRSPKSEDDGDEIEFELLGSDGKGNAFRTGRVLDAKGNEIREVL